jgi:hypothetical protein
MKRTIIIILLAVFFAGGASVQGAKAKRTTLFTLGANEKIIFGKYFVLQQMEQNYFACIIVDTVKKLQTFVFNGKRIATDNGAPFEFHYLNVREENGYIVEYRLQDMCYINIKGKVYGPFDIDIYNKAISSLVFAKDSNGNTDYNKFYYCKTADGIRNCYLHYNDAKEVSFDGILFPKENGAYADCEYLYLFEGKWYAHYSNDSNKVTSLVHGYQYHKNGKCYVNINGEDSRGYDMANYTQFTESGNYAYLYKENGKNYVNINGEESRGYDEVWYLHITENGNYAYAYNDSGAWYVKMNINGEDKSSRAYEKVLCLRFTESGKYAYWYKDNEKYHANVNGKESREYDEIPYYSLRLAENGNCIYKYKENGKWYVNVNINGEDKSNGGYDEINYISEVTASGNYAFECRKMERWHVNINGKDSRDYDRVRNLRLTESGNYAYKYQENGKEYVNVNGKESGGYNKVLNIELTEEGDYVFYYDNDEGKISKNKNGKETETVYLSGMGGVSESYCLSFDNNRFNYFELEIYSTDRKHSLSFSFFKYDYVVIDGKHYGKSPALYAWYDKTKHAFIWNAIEGKKLVIYEYKLN